MWKCNCLCGTCSVGMNIGVPIGFSSGRIHRTEMRRVFVCPEQISAGRHRHWLRHRVRCSHRNVRWRGREVAEYSLKSQASLPCCGSAGGSGVTGVERITCLFFLAEIEAFSCPVHKLTSFSLHLQLPCLISHSWFWVTTSLQVSILLVLDLVTASWAVPKSWYC